MLCSYGNQVENSFSSCGHTCTDFAIGNRRKGRTEKFAKERKIPLLCNGRWQSFHISEK